MLLAGRARRRCVSSRVITAWHRRRPSLPRRRPSLPLSFPVPCAPRATLPCHPQDDAGYMNVWAHKSGVVDAETSRNSLDSEDTYLE